MCLLFFLSTSWLLDPTDGIHSVTRFRTFHWFFTLGHNCGSHRVFSPQILWACRAWVWLLRRFSTVLGVHKTSISTFGGSRFVLRILSTIYFCFTLCLPSSFTIQGSLMNFLDFFILVSFLLYFFPFLLLPSLLFIIPVLIFFFCVTFCFLFADKCIYRNLWGCRNDVVVLV